VDNNKNITFCNWCNQPTSIIWVHGHGQCAICGTNIEECCRGEICEYPSSTITPDLKANDEK